MYIAKNTIKRLMPLPYRKATIGKQTNISNNNNTDIIWIGSTDLIKVFNSLIFKPWSLDGQNT
jgi:hypothetical protein